MIALVRSNCRWRSAEEQLTKVHAAFTITVYLLRVNRALSLRGPGFVLNSPRGCSQNMLRNLLLATLFMGAARGIIGAQCVPSEWFPKTETFSAIADIQGQGPAGGELQLEEQGKRVAATLRDYRGKAIPAVTKLQGSIELKSLSRWVEGPPLARCDCQARTTEVRWKLRGRLLLFTLKD